MYIFCIYVLYIYICTHISGKIVTTSLFSLTGIIVYRGNHAQIALITSNQKNIYIYIYLYIYIYNLLTYEYISICYELNQYIGCKYLSKPLHSLVNDTLFGSLS